MEILCRPLDRWPRELSTVRKVRPFKASFDATRRMLRHELAELDTTTAVVQTAFDEREISLTTGWPRGDRTPKHPGVIVAADTRHGALKWACDDCMYWTDNVRAIALTLARLRLADLYGVTRRGEQYAGWKMLPGPITVDVKTMSIDAAARFIASILGIATPTVLINEKGRWESAKRDAALKVHPDRGGTAGQWKLFQDASTLLDGLHNRR